MTSHSSVGSAFRQPKAVWAVAFACVISFMGIGLVDPILPNLASDLHATPTQVELLFTSYLVVTALAMLVTGWVSSRIGAKRTLVAGLILIVVFAGLAGASGSIGGIVGFRAGWGLGNALFIATSLAIIVGSASGGFAGAIVLYEAALGIGIAIGPLLGGLLGSIGWQWPFFGVAALMAVALIATLVFVAPTPTPPQRLSLLAPLKALRHRTLLTLSLMALAYNWGFFTLLGYAPFPMGLNSMQLGLVFTGWGLLVAIFAVFGAPRLQARFGTVKTLYGSFALMAIDLLVIAMFTSSQITLIIAVIASGAVIGTNNTLVTQAVMMSSPVDRPVASAAYGFVRFIGGGIAPFVAGILVAAVNIHLPFYIGAAALVVAGILLASGAKLVTAAERSAIDEDDMIEASVPELGGAGNASGHPVVIAVGQSGFTEPVLAAGMRIALEFASPVELVHIRESEVIDEQDIDLETPEDAAAVMQEQIDRFAAAGLAARGHVIAHVGTHADIGRVIADRAAEWKARAIVVGPSRRSTAHSGQGSAIDELWRSATCDVLIVRVRSATVTAVTSASDPPTATVPTR
ncbi:MAG: transporter [Rhodoglobus sp.]|nr:transporter [Rhodoglobus sp.]